MGLSDQSSSVRSWGASQQELPVNRKVKGPQAASIANNESVEGFETEALCPAGHESVQEDLRVRLDRMSVPGRCGWTGPADDF